MYVVPVPADSYREVVIDCLNVLTRRRSVAIVLLPLAVIAASGQSPRYVRAYSGPDEKAHVVTAAGDDVAVDAEEGQLGIENAAVSPNGRYAGWLVLQNVDGRGFPGIPGLLVYCGTKRWFGPAAGVVTQWKFIQGGRKVALMGEFPHGSDERFLSVADTRSGRVLRAWKGKPQDEPARWRRLFRGEAEPQP